MINRIFATINNITPVCVSNYIVPVAVFNPYKSGSKNDIVVLTNDSGGKYDVKYEYESSTRDLRKILIDTGQPWVFVYPKKDEVKTGNRFTPPVNEIAKHVDPDYDGELVEMRLDTVDVNYVKNKVIGRIKKDSFRM